jgi:hypothetical protein
MLGLSAKAVPGAPRGHVGQGVNDTLMNVVTDAGRGAYVYLDTAAHLNVSPRTLRR